MQLLKRWSYLLFATALMIGSIVWLRDFTGAVIALSLALCPVLYRNLVENNRKEWMLPCGAALAILLGNLYYVGDLIIFPHSLRSAHRLQDACLMGVLWTVGGLSAEVYSPAGKRIVQDHAVNGTAIERRR